MNMTEPTQFITEDLRGTLRNNVDMRRHTSWRAGGCVQRMYQPADLDDLLVFLKHLPGNEPLLAVGLGSNLLVRDGGLRGTVLLLHGSLSEFAPGNQWRHLCPGRRARSQVGTLRGIASLERRRIFRRYSRYRGRHVGNERRMLWHRDLGM